MMQITSLVQWFEVGCAEFCVRIVLHPEIDGIGVHAPEPIVLMPDFGGRNGTLIYEGSFAATRPPRAVMAAGYTASTMRPVSKAIAFDRQSFKEFLIDFGWSGDPARKPVWMPG